MKPFLSRLFHSKQKQIMLPDAIYAIPGVESNIYYKNIFLTVNSVINAITPCGVMQKINSC